MGGGGWGGGGEDLTQRLTQDLGIISTIGILHEMPTGRCFKVRPCQNVLVVHR